MQIRFFKASPFYNGYLQFFYGSRPALAEASYGVQYEQLMADLFGWSDFWKTNLEKTGLFTVEEVVLNNYCMQRQWALENNKSFNEENWILDILEHQLIKYQPDVFFAHDYGYITPVFLERIRAKVKSIKLIVGWDGLWYNNLALYKEHDIVLSCIEECAHFYSNNGKTGFHFPFGFEKTILPKLGSSTSKTIDTSFVGSLTLGNGKHQERFDTISHISSKAKLTLHANGLATRGRHQYGYSQVSDMVKNGFSNWLKHWQLINKNNGPLFGLAMYEKLAASKISLNIHIDAAKDKAVNMRLLEVTGVGTCLLTDHKTNITDFFAPDKEIVTFKSKEEAVEKIEWLLNNEDELKTISLAGQKRTLTFYSLENRILAFVNFLLPHLQNHN